MSEAIGGAIEFLEREIESHHQAIADLQRTIDSLRPYADDAPLPRRRAAGKPATNGSGRKAKSARPEKGSDGELILQHLRAAGEPVRSGDLADAMKVSAYILKRRLEPLIRQKLVVITGKSRATRIALPGTRAKEVP